MTPTNPTLPLGHTPDYVSGWNARALADGTSTLPALIPQPRPGPIDLLPLYNVTTAGATLELPLGIYKLDQQLLVQKSITIIAAPGSKIIAPVEHACFNAMHANVVIDGLDCDKSNQFMYLGAGADNCELRNCKLMNSLNAVFISPGVKNFKATNVWAGVAGSVGYYLGSSATLINCHGESGTEYAGRVESGAEGTLIQGGSYTNAGSGKDTWGFRNGSGTMTGVKISGNIRVGQDNQNPIPAPGVFSKLQIDHCTFDQQSTGHCYVEIHQGAEVWEQANAFAPATNPNFVLSPGGGNVLHNNAVRPTAPTMQPNH